MKPSLVAVAVLGSVVAAFGQLPGSQTPPEQLLLKDYRPRSIYRIPETDVRKARFPVIDVHSHVYVKDAAGVAEWLSTMDAVGIEKTIVMASGAGARFDSAMALFGAHPDRFEV